MTKIIQIDATTWRMEDGFVRFFLLEGEEKAVLIDSGMNCPNALELAHACTDKSGSRCDPVKWNLSRWIYLEHRLNPIQRIHADSLWKNGTD